VPDQLATAPEWQPPAGPLTVVAAHPDDETFGVGGLIHSWAQADHEVVVITVTDGEGARADLQEPGSVRRRELRAALSCLSDRHIQWHRLGIPDGEVTSRASFVESAIKTRLPTGGTLIVPFEHDGHPDREATGRICIDLARRKGISVLQYPIFAWHTATPKMWESLQLVRFELSAAAQRAKSNAIRCFASQLGAMSSNAAMPAHMLSYFSRPYELFVC
jgi:LmbE family N-acetylglucosaminyl deacetylase